MKFFDLHCDTAYECRCVLGGRNIKEGAHHLSLERGKNLDSWHQIFAIFMPDEFRGADAVRHYETVRDYIFRQEELFPDRFIVCRDRESFLSAEQKGVCGAIMSVEGGSAAAGSLERIRSMYDDGVRLMTLTWNAENELGCGVWADRKGGLTDFGRSAVALMNELSMAVDVSHLSDEGFYDVAEISASPFVASHSCARRLCGHRRNLTDEMFSVINERGGLVGINFSRGFLCEDSNTKIDDIIRHTEHFLSLGGEKTVCLGSDFDGTDMPDDVSGVESMEKLYELFLRYNYSEDTVRDIFWDNAHRFFLNNRFK